MGWLGAKRERRDHKIMNDFRKYWRTLGLASQLSKEQRMKVTQKFLKLVEKSKEEHAKRMCKTMKERNMLLRIVTKDI